MSRLERINAGDSIALPRDFTIADHHSPLLTLHVYRQLSEIADEWRDFEAEAAGTFYQTHAWCSAWFETSDDTSEPCVVAGRDRGGELRFLLPLCLRRHHGLVILEWIAMPQTTYGYGLYDREFLPRARSWFSGRGWEIARQIGRVDALNLGEMPETFHGFPHPLSDWFSCEGANRGYQILLEADYNRLYERKRSSATRRSNRKRDNKLASLGELEFGLPATHSQNHDRIDEMFRQQQRRLSERGIHGVFDARDRRFIHRLADAQHGEGAALLAYNLSIDRRMVAMKLGGRYGNIYWGLISSLESGFAPNLSPGDAALRHLIATCCKERIAVLDLAAGDADYKSHWADVVIPLHACIRGVSPLGYVWAGIAMTCLVAKRTVKRSPRLWELAQHLRRTFADVQARVTAEPPLGCLIGLNLAGIG
jgi:CelD/BcsL family acetyltransferase involved in cellulose biosynthesis